MPKTPLLIATLLITLFSSASRLPAESKVNKTRLEKVRQDRKKVEAEGYWIYNDFNKGLAQAKKLNKPLLVVLRCIPCEECVKLDEDLMEKDEHLKSFMDQFVRVRLISTNGLDLSIFQYDYDQSFAVFMLNADKTIYARFGTRSHHTLWSDDVSIKGLAKTMQAALTLHENYATVKNSLQGKQGKKPDVPSPEKYPHLKGKFKSKLSTGRNTVKSCIHCHQIGDAQRQFYLQKQKSIPEKILFQYPHPKILGLILDPKEKATASKITPNSIAKKAGFQKGDEILFLEGQPILSIADVQWVLHHAKTKDQLSAKITRDGTEINLTLALSKRLEAKR